MDSSIASYLANTRSQYVSAALAALVNSFKWFKLDLNTLRSRIQTLISWHSWPLLWIWSQRREAELSSNLNRWTLSRAAQFVVLISTLTSIWYQSPTVIVRWFEEKPRSLNKNLRFCYWKAMAESESSSCCRVCCFPQIPTDSDRFESRGLSRCYEWQSRR